MPAPKKPDDRQFHVGDKVRVNLHHGRIEEATVKAILAFLAAPAHMGVTIRRVYIVPAGKGLLTNAYGLSNAIALTDSLGQYLTKTQIDYVMAHELRSETSWHCLSFGN